MGAFPGSWRREIRASFRLGEAAAAILLLVAPALWNRFPLLQFDTGGYVARWHEGTLEESRSPVYGLFLNAFEHVDFWPAVVVQAALTVWVLALVLRVYHQYKLLDADAASKMRG